MVVLDTGVVLDRIKGRKDIRENVTAVSVIEFPPILEYSGFQGNVFYPRLDDFKLAYEIQEKLYRMGKSARCALNFNKYRKIKFKERRYKL